MSVLGYAVGYGSLWRFPYIMYKNGGGVFLIPYTFFVIIIAIPVFILETGLGQIYQKSLPIIFEQKIHKKWKGFGIWAIMVATTMATYYNYIQAISIRYFLCSFTSPLPWSLGEVQVLGYENANAFLLTNILNVSDSINTYGSLNTPLLLCYFSSMIAVFFTIFKGPTYSGRIALVTASVPYLLLIIMFINGCTLDGSSAGLYYLFMPDLSLLKTTTIWVDALVQVLFQFSCGMGVLVSFGSYRNKSKSLKKAAYGLIIGTFICGILGGIIVFQYLGHMSHLSGVAINALPL
jgi:SNF family Na+-dependent transporter